MLLIDSFDREVECCYKGEIYSVRDNGSIKRHCREGKKPRPSDEKWTFGSYDPEDGYAKFCGQAVHRIVATAFHGEPPTSQHVVDHIDTNRQNNRPENLRWVTKLENVLLNEITRTKLERICRCPIEEILKDWSILRDKNLPPNIEWMKAVTKEEAQKTLDFWQQWIKDDRWRKQVEQQLENSLYKEQQARRYSPVYRLEPLDGEISLNSYFARLKNGEVFSFIQTRFDKYKYSIIDFCLNKDGDILSVATEGDGKGIKNFFITTVTFENGEFKYDTRSFFSIQGVEKYMTLARGEEWTGGDVIDDYC